jgi:hypothetical protein
MGKLSNVYLRCLTILFAVVLFSGCETERMQETEYVAQQNLFLQSLDLVESAGAMLQDPGLSKEDIVLAMDRMDRGLEQAFRVEKWFLQKLDVRLPKMFNEAFIPGVERYRIGVESSNQQEQIEGLNLLSRWSKFWLQEKDDIQKKMMSLSS